MSAYVHDTSFFSRRALILVCIFAFHGLIIFVMASGLGRRVIEVVAPPIKTDIIEEVQQREQPPPPPPPEFERPQVEIPPPEVHIDFPMETNAITDVTTKAVPKPPPAPPAPRAMTHASGKFGSSEDFYPPSSIRLEEQGSVTVKVCVAPNGKLAEPPRVERSSNSARLDDAALKLAKAGRFTPGTIDGTPTTDCFSFRVKFELKK